MCHCQFFTNNIYRQYFPLTSHYWDHISEDAKDLVSKVELRLEYNLWPTNYVFTTVHLYITYQQIRQMLTVDANKRIGIEDILAHPWIELHMSVPCNDFGEDYFRR